MSDIDVSGDYPAEKMPELLETARKISECGSCHQFNCKNCPADCGFHDDLEDKCKRHDIDTIDNPEWFRAFVEKYEPRSDKMQGHWHSMPSSATASDAVCGMTRVVKSTHPSIMDYSPIVTVEGAPVKMKRIYNHHETISDRRKRMLHSSI